MQILEQISEVASSDIEIPELPAKGTVLKDKREELGPRALCLESSQGPTAEQQHF